MEPHPSEYKQLDTAASQLTHILREAGICHVFFGGYAASLIGSSRVTKDINVITETSATRALSEIPEFTWSSDDECWKYSYRGVQASIGISTPGGDAWNVPSPRAAGRHTINPRDVPDRSLYAKIDILHPSILILTKLQAWYLSETSDNLAVHMRHRAHLMDIMSALEWLSDEELRIDFRGHPGVPKRELQKLLCRLYQHHRQARPYLAEVLGWKEMRDVLNSCH